MAIWFIKPFGPKMTQVIAPLIYDMDLKYTLYICPLHTYHCKVDQIDDDLRL